MAGVPTHDGEVSRQSLIDFMREFNAANTYLPTIADMARGTGLMRTAVVWHLEKLREQGRINYVDRHMARSLRLIR